MPDSPAPKTPLGRPLRPSPRPSARASTRVDLRTAFTTVLETLAPGLPLDDAHWLPLAPLLRLQSLETGQTVLLQGQLPQAFYAVVQGEIEARFSGLDGQVSVLEAMRPPRLFGLAGFVCRQPSRYEAVALRPSVLIAIGPAAYTRLMDELPGFARALMQEFASRFAGTLGLLAASRHATAAERLMLGLQQLDQTHGEDLPGQPGWRQLRVSQAELAALANVSRQTVNEWLGQQAREGRLCQAYRRILWRPPTPGAGAAASLTGS
ncbi:Crp/Fnr family transcriptional regulator [Mitsuaria sp. WAJ17]|uniref:Crp/Fnr family transcriptional regulator n=1 Tax=Mitsuaria sp. WAJ17 TaxID=2761452 RepID=UPI001601F32B|nr:Crp/Fnr family transcriptional regulator [Mitsuaria sp. WAJ17]MBB2483885.1 Crp/Fnr family transcriptional regulator [Mitsuaria sp. WAJ17]